MFLESFFSSVLSGIILKILDFKKFMKRRKVAKVKHDRKLILSISKKVIEYIKTKRLKNKKMINNDNKSHDCRNCDPSKKNK